MVRNGDTGLICDDLEIRFYIRGSTVKGEDGVCVCDGGSLFRV